MSQLPSADHWRASGVAAAARGDLSTAADYLNRYLAQAPHDTATHQTLAAVYLQAGRPDFAIQLLDGLVRQQPQNPEAVYQRGWVLTQVGRSAEAAADYQRALQLNPAHVGALQALHGPGAGPPPPYPGAPSGYPSGVNPANYPGYGRSELMTTTDTDTSDLLSLVYWGGLLVVVIAAFSLVIVGGGMLLNTDSGRPSQTGLGWLLLALGLLIGGGGVTAFVYLIRRESKSP